ncbi:MAG: HU family DNA-binding protein [Bacteroidota bacterium]|jgi:DNA-binding protein HU-beta
MNKADLIVSIADKTGLTKADSSRALEAALEAITGALKKEERVALVGFGTFTAKERMERLGINPRTLESVNIPSKIVVKFKSGFKLDAKLNGVKK